MAAMEGVQTYAGRLETFHISHHPPKRRASSNKKRGPASIEWPATAPPAEEMAKAGFYFMPTATNPDNAMCFSCQRQLDGWEQEDNPALEHLTHSPDCGWAINVNIALRLGDPARVDEDPMDPRLVEARQSTFLGKWPHEHKKGWKCKVSKMVEAGWSFDPSPEYDDGVTCFYCSLSLDGWEPKDNPLAEHQRRSPDCPFFAALESHAATRQPKKSKKGRASTASRASRLSVQSNMTIASDAPSIMSINSAGDVPATEDDSIMTTATTATTASKPGKGRKAASKPRAAAKSKGRTTRGKKVSTAEDEVSASQYQAQLHALEMELEAPDAEATPEQPKKRAPKRGAKTEPSMLDAPMPEAAHAPPKRATRTRANSKLKAPERLSEDQLQLQSEIDYAIEASLLSERSTPKPSRGLKRTSDGLPKAESSVISSETSKQYVEPAAGKPKKGRKPKPAHAALTEAFVEPRSSELEEELQQIAVEEETKKPGRKASEARRIKQAPEAQPEPAPAQNIPAQSAQDIVEQPVELIELPTAFPAPAHSRKTPSPAKDARSSASPPPPTPTPAKVAPPSANRSSPVRPRLSNQRPGLAERTPSAASNASDEENVAPSAKPTASARRPLGTLSPNKQTTKIPLAASTPTASPSKRGNLVGGLASSLPWSATDFETIFLPSPTSGKLGRSSGFGFGSFTSLTQTEKENLAELDRFAANMGEDGVVDLKEVVLRVKAALTSPEKKMSVQEWINFNALRGEERLRGECERMVGLFEREGGRALRSLEGTICRE